MGKRDSSAHGRHRVKSGESTTGAGGRDRKPPRTDVALAARALKESWPLSDEMREKVLTRLVGIVENPKANSRAVTIASKALLESGRLNLSAIEVAIKAEEHTDMSERLGILEEQFAQKPGNGGRR